MTLSLSGRVRSSGAAACLGPALARDNCDPYGLALRASNHQKHEIHESSETDCQSQEFTGQEVPDAEPLLLS